MSLPCSFLPTQLAEPSQPVGNLGWLVSPWLSSSLSWCGQGGAQRDSGGLQDGRGDLREESWVPRQAFRLSSTLGWTSLITTHCLLPARGLAFGVGFLKPLTLSGHCQETPAATSWMLSGWNQEPTCPPIWPEVFGFLATLSGAIQWFISFSVHLSPPLFLPCLQPDLSNSRPHPRFEGVHFMMPRFPINTKHYFKLMGV